MHFIDQCIILLSRAAESMHNAADVAEVAHYTEDKSFKTATECDIEGRLKNMG